MEKQRKDEEEDQDRISQLPQSFLHGILCYLSQKEAIRTCVLSKSWRHLGPTRPFIQFGEDFFDGIDEEAYLSVLDKTLQRYHDQNLSPRAITIAGMKEAPKSFELLEKWVPIALQNLGVNKIGLSINSSETVSFKNFFRLPSSVLSKAEFLKELYLHCCQIDPLVDDDDKVLCRHLRKLNLKTVYITDATLEKIMSRCPSIEDLGMYSCKGLQTMKLTKAPNLKFFKFQGLRVGWDCHSIEIIDAPSIESIDIDFCPSWIQNYFPRLKSLRLDRVPLSNESIDKFSTNLPCLEKLTLSRFSISEQFKISSRTIKHLTISVKEGPSLKAAIIEATNILCFKFSCHYLPSSFSFTTTSIDWKSKVCVAPTVDFRSGASSSSWFYRLSEIFKALRTSQISLHVDGIPQVVPNYCGVVIQPFEDLSLEDLSLEEENSFSSVPVFFNCLFRNFRPRNIQQIWYADHHPFMCGNNKRENQLIEFLSKILLSRSERAQYFGQLNLEDVNMEASYENEEKWTGVEGTSSLSEFALPWNTLKIRFRLKWWIE